MRFPRVRFTVRWMMVVVAVVAGLLFLYVSFGGAYLVLAGLALLLSGSCWGLVRDRRQLSVAGFSGSVLAANIAVATACIYGFGFCGDLGLILGCVFGCPMALGLGAAWATAATRQDAPSRRSPLLTWPWVVAFALSPLISAVNHWPLRLAFLASRPALDRLADRVASGQAPRRPVWAGVFRVSRAVVDTKTGNIGLITFADPTGNTGFVRLGHSTPPERRSGPFYSLAVEVPMGGGWWFQTED
jgi:hypothetical protein